MKAIFVDTSHLIACFHPRDFLHQKAVSIENDLRDYPLITSDFVLTELLNYFSKFPANYKQRIVSSVDTIISSQRYTLVECSQSSFLRGKDFYKKRLDHGYSLTDCTSMNIMDERKITDVLTSDGHFEREGFKILL